MGASIFGFKHTVAAFLVGLVLLVLPNSSVGQDDDCCHVIRLEAEEYSQEAETWTFAATFSSLYEIETGWNKYCDFFHVQTLGGEVLGKRIFGHPHPTEQPFTRRVRNVVLPEGVDTVMAIAHDSVNGFCGTTVNLTVTGATPTFATAPPIATQPPEVPPTTSPTQPNTEPAAPSISPSIGSSPSSGIGTSPESSDNTSGAFVKHKILSFGIIVLCAIWQ